MKPHIVIIGVGNEYRSDDGIGIYLARMIGSRNIPEISVVEESGEGTSLMSRWEAADRVLVIDAVKEGNSPGKVYHLNAKEDHIAKNFFHYSSHMFSVAEAVELARTMKLLPRYLRILGIEGKNFTPGSVLSRELIDRIPEYLKEIDNAILELSVS
jgi:hydrogenase maturation protease